MIVEIDFPRSGDCDFYAVAAHEWQWLDAFRHRPPAFSLEDSFSRTNWSNAYDTRNDSRLTNGEKDREGRSLECSAKDSTVRCFDPITGNGLKEKLAKHREHLPPSAPPATDLISGKSFKSKFDRLTKGRLQKFTVYSKQEDWDSTFIDSHEPGYGTGDQHIANFPLYKSLARLKAQTKPLGLAFSESTLLSSGTIEPDKDFWAVNNYDIFKDGRIDSTSLYANTRGGPTPSGTKDYFTITGGTGKYFGVRGTITVKRLGEGSARYLKSTYKMIR